MPPQPPPPPPPPGSSGGSPYPSGPPTGPPTRPSGGLRDDEMPWVVPGGPPPGPWSSGPDDGTAPPRRRLLVTVAAVFAVLALLGATVAFVTDGSDDTGGAEATDTTTTEADEPTATTEAPEPAEPDVPPISEEEFLALIEELEADVEEARGLEFIEEVEVELADGAAFENRLLEDFEDDVAEIEEAEAFYRALGLLDSDRSLLEELRAIYSAGVLGFYDPESDELVVRGRTPSPYVQQTIVHELVHALDDQHFELHRPEYDDRDDELATGFSAVVEGNARRIDEAWLQEQPEEFRRQAEAEEAAFADGIDPTDFPEIILFELGASYELGSIFVDRLLSSGGERAVDAALTDPPDTSEQFIFPGLYEEREPRIEVPPPPADGEVIDEGVIGALFLIGMFSTNDSSVNQADALRAVRGWGGDWAVTWSDGDVDCVRADFVGDTPDDTAELESALELWAESSEAAEVSMVDERVRLDSCGGGAGGVPPQV